MVDKNYWQNFLGVLVGIFLVCFFVFGLQFVYKYIVYAFSWNTIAVDTVGVDYNTGRSSSVVVESETLAYVAYCNYNSTGLLRYAPVTNMVAGTVEDVVSMGTTCDPSNRDIDIILDGSTPVVALKHVSSTFNIMLALRDGGGIGCLDSDWSCYGIHTLASSTQGLTLEIFSSTYGLAFHDAVEGDLVYGSCASSCTSAVNWTFETVDSSSVLVGRYPDLVFTSSGVPVVSYVDATNGVLKYAIRDSGGTGCTDVNWSCYIVDSVNVGAIGTAIDIDSLGKIGISYVGSGDSRLRFAYQDDGDTGCTGGDSTFTCEDVNSSNSSFQDLNFHGDNPMISWRQSSAKLSFSSKYLGVWSTETADESAASTGGFTSMGRFNDDVYIAYHNVTDAEVMLANATIAFNTAPTSIEISPAQTSASVVTVTSTITDLDSDTTSLIVEYSLDNLTWVSSTISGVTPSVGISTSTGSITGIASAPSIALTIEWNIEADIPDTDDTTVYFRLTPNDGTESGSTVSTTAFAIDTKDPTVPGNLSVNTTSTNSVVLNFSTTSTDTNFGEYKLFYSTATPVTESGTAVTSSTAGHARLGNRNFSDFTVSSPIIGLDTNTLYYINLFAYDTWENSTSSANEISFYTLADTPGAPTVSASTTAILHLIINTSTNTNITEYSFCSTTDNTNCATNGYIQSADGSFGANVDWATSSLWGGTSGLDVVGLDINTGYSFLAKARNGNNIETLFSSPTTVVYTLAMTPGTPTVTSLSETSVKLIINTSTNPSNTEFTACLEVNGSCITNGYIQTDGSLGASAVWAVSSVWGGINGVNVTGLSAGTNYSLMVKARNGDNIETSGINQSGETVAEAQTPPTPGCTSCGIPDPEPECNPLLQSCTNPFGEVQINNGNEYTNKLGVVINFNATGATHYALSNTPEFTGSFIDYTSKVSHTLFAGDGEKIVYGRLKNSFGSYDVFDKIILDTVPPDPIVLAFIYNGIDETTGSVTRPPVLWGTAEPESKVIIKIKKKDTGLSIFSSISTGTDEFGDLSSLVMASTKVFPFVSLAAAVGETYIVNTKDDGTWRMQFYSFFDPENYILVFTVVDPAGNESSEVEVPLNIAYEDPCKSNSPPNYCTKLTDVCLEPNPPSSCLPPDPCLGPNPPQSCTEQLLVEEKETKETNIINNEQNNNSSSGSFTHYDDGGLVSSTIIKTDIVSTTMGSATSIGIVERGVENMIIVAVKTGEFVQHVIDNPVVEKINETTVAPTVAVIAAVNMATGFQLPNVLAYLRYIFAQPLMLLRRRKQKKWGVVYDSYTKQPLDLATIRLLDSKSGQILRTQVTDMQGRFFLIIDPGTYTLEVNKDGFSGFSQYLKHFIEDNNYINLYHGEEIKVGEDGLEVNYNIPVDPVLKEDTTEEVLREYAKNGLKKIVSMTGLIITVISFVISPKLFIGLLLVFHIFSYSVIRRLAYQKIGGAFGKVIDALSERPLGKVVVRVFDAAYNKLINTTITDSKGRYAILVGPSVYYATYEKPNYIQSKSEEMDFSSEKTGGLGGLIARNEKLQLDKRNNEKERKKFDKIIQKRKKGIEKIRGDVIGAKDNKKDASFDFKKLRDVAQYGDDES